MRFKNAAGLTPSERLLADLCDLSESDIDCPKTRGEQSRCIAGAVAPGDVVGRTRNHARSVGG
jgi:hypothetical protein